MINVDHLEKTAKNFAKASEATRSLYREQLAKVTKNKNAQDAMAAAMDAATIRKQQAKFNNDFAELVHGSESSPAALKALSKPRIIRHDLDDAINYAAIQKLHKEYNINTPYYRANRFTDSVIR